MRAAALAALAVAVAVLVLGYDAAHVRRQGRDDETLLPDYAPLQQRFAVERAHADAARLRHWWEPESPRFLGQLVLLWWRNDGIAAAGVAIRPASNSLREALLHDAPPPARPRGKAALGTVRGLLTDEPTEVEVAPLDWELARWAEGNLPKLRSLNPNLSTFGASGAVPHPGILAVHGVLETADGWLVCGLRRADAAYCPRTWSMSFEEQVELADETDQTLADTTSRGIAQEFGPHVSDGVTASRLAGIGVVHEVDEIELLCGVGVTLVTLSCSLAEVWRSLARTGDVVDRAEHQSWVGIRFASLRDAQRFARLTARAPGPVEFGELGRRTDVAFEVAHPPWATGEGLPPGRWHPTSLPRLLVWAEAAHFSGRLRR